MGQKHTGRSGSSRSNSPNPRGLQATRPDAPQQAPQQQHLKGISRLVNPPNDEPELPAQEEDPVEREYVGRLLHVADEALHHDKRDHRKRRSGIH
jgi:hypothetical protein